VKEFFVSFAKYNKEANKAVYSILDKLSNEEREKDRGSYYKSLTGIYTHILGGTVFFLGMFKEALSASPAAKAFAALKGADIPKVPLSAGQWKALAGSFEKADDALISLASALSGDDLKAEVKIAWYDGNPASVPLAFMLEQLIAHGTHHRGQISQILDSLKIDNDYSGLATAFIPQL